MSAGITLRRATPADAPRMQELWRRCFGDEQAYLDLCFDQGGAVSHGMLLEAEGVVQSMLLAFSQEMTLPEGDSVPMWYVYAFCTHPDGQSRGYGRTLLAWTEEEGRKAGAKAVVMVPGEPDPCSGSTKVWARNGLFHLGDRDFPGNKHRPGKERSGVTWRPIRCCGNGFCRAPSHVSYPLEMPDLAKDALRRQRPRPVPHWRRRGPRQSAGAAASS